MRYIGTTMDELDIKKLDTLRIKKDLRSRSAVIREAILKWLNDNENSVD
jgi:metal-responsive CopG/Arc/MetJ family transcriptional regulator